ncbi:uncharacterized protein BO96DRAFT_439434 [Aspergillus niger CBS 101883]|uniref:Contig An04c0250, genomic contig n=2 Tax=Aspergillus niger TaxID=5061 RepID=A2QJQ5_ASPNC|nr:uncharacterized protein BO96DRAFT_439434 [Aspergillus niger CBS 101883]XP_059605264.1 uncharacterized protein An04g07890 [Aspergillus niger]PYH50914.1 hypothetical protein BO96DRAFT_439434 [Aspergillus niger CBS 101883]CAK47946.1 unnamed protein product [Aspergillus niger]
MKSYWSSAPSVDKKPRFPCRKPAAGVRYIGHDCGCYVEPFLTNVDKPFVLQCTTNSGHRVTSIPPIITPEYLDEKQEYLVAHGDLDTTVVKCRVTLKRSRTLRMLISISPGSYTTAGFRWVGNTTVEIPADPLHAPISHAGYPGHARSSNKRDEGQSSLSSGPIRRNKRPDIIRSLIPLKAAQYSIECDSDVFVMIRVKGSGRRYIFNSSPSENWLPSMPELSGYYPTPMIKTLEDVVPQYKHCPEPDQEEVGTRVIPSVKKAV